MLKRQFGLNVFLSEVHIKSYVPAIFMDSQSACVKILYIVNARNTLMLARKQCKQGSLCVLEESFKQVPKAASF